MINIKGGTSRFLPTSYIFDLKYMGNGTESEFDMLLTSSFYFIVYTMKLLIALQQKDLYSEKSKGHDIHK
jgi:hypothetical protein